MKNPITALSGLFFPFFAPLTFPHEAPSPLWTLTTPTTPDDRDQDENSPLWQVLFINQITAFFGVVSSFFAPLACTPWKPQPTVDLCHSHNTRWQSLEWKRAALVSFAHQWERNPIIAYFGPPWVLRVIQIFPLLLYRFLNIMSGN